MGFPPPHQDLQSSLLSSRVRLCFVIEMRTRIVLGFVCIFHLAGLTSADSIDTFNILDQEGKNTCIADLRCYLSLDEQNKFTLSFDLILDKNTERTIYKVLIEKMEEGDILKKQLFLCYDDVNKTAILTSECNSTTVIPAGLYHIDYVVEVPVFKDIASMMIWGPNGMGWYRSVVSTLSSFPPITLGPPGGPQ
ncbi:uncharacterized protein LOC128986578 [Macrosteles quadrilineatus]|uniref:uncharacterized protein LOC128986578 n=1 Tax=Macrosteles quadrilineatus TaxID=74068 RepID=UPI0023E0DFA7|nr:uncharacterized protein LOC128986578 [Macrosteles quadrilineatus]